MSRRSITAYLAAAALGFGAIPLMAQDKQSGARPNGTGSSSGSSVSRPSGGGDGGGSNSGDRGGSTAAGRAAASAPSQNSGSQDRRGGQERGGYSRPSGGERTGDRAVPRSGSSSGDRGRVSGGSSSATGSSDYSDQRAVPRGARPREGRPVLESSVPRGTVPGRGYDYYYNRYNYYYSYYPYGYYWPGYGYGLGYFYDPWMWGSPYGYGGYYDPYYGGGGGAYYQSQYGDLGSLRLRVKPNNAQVFVDGYFMGEIDNFDGTFQKLTLESGAHRIEIRAEGYEPVQFEVKVVPGETITYKGDLKRIQ